MAEPVAEEGDAVAEPYLTRREKDVVKLIAQGLTSKEIGRALGISNRTVDAHIGNLKERYGMHAGRAGMVVWAQQYLIMASDCRDDAIRATCAAFRDQINAITGGNWRHPNLAAVADRLRRIETELLLWSRNQQLIDEAPRKTATEAPEDTDHSNEEANGKPT